MSQSPSPPEPRDNPFWAYRDPHTGRWVTLMTAEQCRRLSKQVFIPKNRQDADSSRPSDNEADESAR